MLLQSGRGTPLGIDSYIYGPMAGERPFEEGGGLRMTPPAPSSVGPQTHRLASKNDTSGPASRPLAGAGVEGLVKQSTATASSDYPKSLSQPSGGEETGGRQGAVDTSNSLKGISTLESRRNVSTHRAQDALQSVLERGNRLREAMIVSTLTLDKHSNEHSTLPPSNFSAGGNLKLPIGGLLSADQDEFFPLDENRAIDLVLGSSPLEYGLDVETAVGMSADEDEEAGVTCSELGDAQYDESLLNELFYKYVGEEDEVDGGGAVEEMLDDPGYMGTPLTAALTDAGNERQRGRQVSSHNSSLVLDVALSDQEDQSPALERKKKIVKKQGATNGKKAIATEAEKSKGKAPKAAKKKEAWYTISIC
jgi:hypothetical protein